MKFKMSYEELQKAIEYYLNNEVVKSPIIVEDLYVLDENESAVEWEDIEIKTSPKTTT